MFGLEKQPGEKFAFDLEKKIKDHPEYRKELLEKVEKRMVEIKHMLREGANEKDFEQLGVLLHGYSALEKVLKKVK